MGGHSSGPSPEQEKLEADQDAELQRQEQMRQQQDTEIQKKQLQALKRGMPSAGGNNSTLG